MRFFFIPVLFYAGVAYIIRKTSGLRPGTSIASAFIVSMPVMYAGVYISNTLTVPFAVMTVISVAGIFLLAVDVIRNRISLLNIPTSVVAFAVLAVLIAIMDHKARIGDFDEFWHWGMMIKESLRLDNFYCLPGSNQIIHKDYPPFLALSEILTSKMMGKYFESHALFGLHLMETSVIVLPLLDEYQDHRKTQKGLAIVASIALLLAVIALFDGKHTIGTLLADIPVGLLFAFGLFLIISGKAAENIYYRVLLIFTCVDTLMAKQVGFALLLVLVFVYVLSIFKDRYAKKKTELFTLGGMIAIPAAFYMSWNHLVKHYQVSDIRSVNNSAGQFDIKGISIKNYFDILLGNAGSDLQKLTSRAAYKAFFDRNISALSVKISIFVFLICFLIVVVVLLHIRSNVLIDRKQAILLVISGVTGCLGYIFMLSVLFTFCFTSDEMMELRGFERYCDTLAIGLSVTFMMVAFGNYYASMGQNRWESETQISKSAKTAESRNTGKNDRAGKSILVIAATIILLLLDIIPVKTILTDKKIHADTYNFFSAIAAPIINSTSSGSNVTIVYNPPDGRNGGIGWYGGLQSYLQYYANDRKLLWGMDIYDADLNDESAKSNALDQIRNSDYVYFRDVNDQIKNVLGSYTSGTEIASDTCWKVESDGDGDQIRLSLCLP